MKKIMLFSVLALISMTATATENNQNPIVVSMSHPTNSALFNNDMESLAISDFSSSEIKSTQPADAPSAYGLIGFALALGVLGFRMKNSVH